MNAMLTQLVDQAGAAWHRELEGAASCPDRLVEGLLERWRRNAATMPPAGALAMQGVSDEYGWSAALELYLSNLADFDERSRALLEAFRRAEEVLEDDARRDAWLGDVLALRRMPHPAHALPLFRRSVADLAVADHILDSVSFFCRCIPASDEESYAFFDRIYAMLTNALVSELAESGVPGWVRSQFQSGRRLLPPDARSVFRELAGVRCMVSGWPDAERSSYAQTTSAWAGRIGELVDTLTVLNPDLADLGASRLCPRRRPARLSEDLKLEMSRYFDDSFCRLLIADARETELKENLLAALAELGATRGLYVDRLTVQAMLWGGQKGNPLAKEDSVGDVVFGEDGALALSPRMAERIRRYAA